MKKIKLVKRAESQLQKDSKSPKRSPRSTRKPINIKAINDDSHRNLMPAYGNHNTQFMPHTSIQTSSPLGIQRISNDKFPIIERKRKDKSMSGRKKVLQSLQIETFVQESINNTQDNRDHRYKRFKGGYETSLG